MLNDTIAAIATPLGEGGLAVVRVSGPRALAVGDQCFRPLGRGSHKPSAAPTHTVQYGQVLLGQQVVDEVLALVLRAPRSFTREDTVEFCCHGGLLAARSALEAVLGGGARLAEPGEFTKRAFLNGRIDLAQAEAVADVIRARTELALAAANEQLAGKLSQRVRELRNDLLHTLAHVEAHIDFPEEDIAPDTRAQLLERLERAGEAMRRLLATAREGQLLRQGLRAAIIGRPNVGKSSLLNQLLGHDRAIVSPIPGTTRDTIAETANIRGLPVVLIDTAGLRDSSDALEQEGMRRSRATVTGAELILHVLDSACPFSAEDQRYLDECAARPRIVVLNKCDLEPRLELPAGTAGPRVAVSCRTGQGIEALKDKIKELAWAGEIRAEMIEVTINSRHQDALRRAQEATDRTRAALSGDLSLELVAVDLRMAVDAVGEIVGQTATEDLLDAIFSQFCVGK
ncbi:MAG: tRNA uridine-5-carboxymethylaminomethyl(34) synthesis GTPase MnmE [Verrucomicrobia bacterium]|nr:tRNA uridine-5-carboxymethylaminomethyl(34) synthesis GTPase MnmE [Verrucomicrobiota bacterium]